MSNSFLYSDMTTPVTNEQKVIVLGYGSQGRALALNLRDSGYGVILGLKSGSRSRRRATDDGFERARTIRQALRVAVNPVVIFAFPDHLHGRAFESQIGPNLGPGATLVFLHGMSVHFGLVRPPADCDVILLAPHAPGVAVREKYLSDRSLSAFYAIYQDKTGRAGQTALSLAAAMGFAEKRLVPTTFAHETLGDMFGEQAVLCGGLAMLIKSGFEVLVKNGLPPENAYLEVAYQLDLIIDLIKRHGIEGMFKRISTTARYGSLVSGPRIIDSSVKKRMEDTYRRIANGSVAKELSNLSESQLHTVDKAIRALTCPELDAAARKYSPLDD